jgi:hypothetical protein
MFSLDWSTTAVSSVPSLCLGEAGLDRVRIAKEQDRLTAGYVVLANGEREFFASEEAQTVYSRLRDYRLLDGKFGPYWWITEQFQPASSMRQWQRFDPDAPF